MKRVHYTDSYLMNPQHPVTVNIIGAGGTGSQVLTGMARLVSRSVHSDIRVVRNGLRSRHRDGRKHWAAALRTVRPGTEQVTMSGHKDKQFFRKRLESGGEFLSVGIEGGKADRNCEHHHYLYG